MVNMWVVEVMFLIYLILPVCHGQLFLGGNGGTGYQHNYVVSVCRESYTPSEMCVNPVLNVLNIAGNYA